MRFLGHVLALLQTKQLDPPRGAVDDPVLPHSRLRVERALDTEIAAARRGGEDFDESLPRLRSSNQVADHERERGQTDSQKNP